MRVLLDANLPVAFAALLTGHQVETVHALKQALTGSDGGPWVLATLFLMPVVAGAGWAWLACWLTAYLRRRPSAR